MTSLSVKRFRVEGIGKPIIELVDHHDCIADPLASLYLTTKEHFSHNTVLRQAYELRFFLLWCNEHNIDIYGRTKSFEFLSELEAREFVSHARRNSLTSKLTPIQKDPTDKYLDNALNQVMVRSTTVSVAATNGRLRRAAEYLSFTHQELNRHKLRATEPSCLQTALNLLANSIEKQPSVLEVQSIDALKDNNDFATALDALSLLKQDADNSPFTKLTRFRNNLIVDLIVDSGIRRASIAVLKISDVFFEGDVSKIAILSNVIDPSDPAGK